MNKIRCSKCRQIISSNEKYAITLFFVKEMPSSPYYEHLECPKNFPFIE